MFGWPIFLSQNLHIFKKKGVYTLESLPLHFNLSTTHMRKNCLHYHIWINLHVLKDKCCSKPSKSAKVTECVFTLSRFYLYILEKNKNIQSTTISLFWGIEKNINLPSCITYKISFTTLDWNNRKCNFKKYFTHSCT